MLLFGLLLGIASIALGIKYAITEGGEAVARKAETERLRREAEHLEGYERAKVEAHMNQQRGYLESLIELGDDSLALFEAMTKDLMDTEELLDQAERDFGEGAFAPFWDSVEQAARRLGRFDETLRKITTNTNRYTELTRLYEAPSPPFPINLDSVKGMAAASTTTDRMRTAVRQAQRNFQFATIFEQRKTNQLLVAGFTNLAQALDGMGRRIESSIKDLGGQISQMSYELNDSLQRLDSNSDQRLAALQESAAQETKGIVSGIKILDTTLRKVACESAERHTQALAMLDNIQRRRKPPLI